MKLYSELAEYYFDIEKPSRDITGEFSFLESEFKKYSVKKALDAGCGSGEHVAHLSFSGYDVLGIDNSPEMMEVARNRFPRAHFKTAAMESFRDTESYDCIFSIFGSFDYLLEDEEVEYALYNFNNLLNDNGVIILELWHSFPILAIKRKPISNVASIISNEKIIHRDRGFRIIPHKNKTIVEVNYIYQVDNREIKDRHLMRAFSLDEIREFLKNNKFKVLHFYGGINRSRLTDDRAKIIVIAQKI